MPGITFGADNSMHISHVTSLPNTKKGLECMDKFVCGLKR